MSKRRPRAGASPTQIKCEAGRCCVYPTGDTTGEPIRCFTPGQKRKSKKAAKPQE